MQQQQFRLLRPIHKFWLGQNVCCPPIDHGCDPHSAATNSFLSDNSLDMSKTSIRVDHIHTKLWYQCQTRYFVTKCSTDPVCVDTIHK